MNLEAANKLLYHEGSVCCKLKLNKENKSPSVLDALEALGISASGSGVHLCYSQGWDLIKAALYHGPSIVQDL